MKKIGIVAGTRPEVIKLIPLYLELKRRKEFNPIFISTGQHREMLDQVFEVFDVQPDYSLELMQNNQSIHDLSAKILYEFPPVLEKSGVDMVVVQGDTTTAFYAALCAYYAQIPVAHVEAGLRTGDRYAPFPEEMNRKMISTLSELHFAPTEEAAANLEAEAYTSVHVVGNTVIDSLLLCRSKLDEGAMRKRLSEKCRITFKNPVVGVTAHRRESFGSGLESICDALLELAEDHRNYDFVFPVHPNPKVNKVIHSRLGDVSNILLCDPLLYDEWVYLMSVCEIILTDSGGIQEEAPSLNVPVIVMRDKTERPEGVSAGATILAGTGKLNIITAFREIMSNDDLRNNMKTAQNPYGDGKSSRRIADFIDQWLSRF